MPQSPELHRCGRLQCDFDSQTNARATLIIAPDATLEWFSIECRKTKSKVVSLANHEEHRQSNKPIKTRIQDMQLMRSAEKTHASDLQLVLVLLLTG